MTIATQKNIKDIVKAIGTITNTMSKVILHNKKESELLKARVNDLEKRSSLKNKWGEELKPKKIKWHDQDITMPFNCAIYKDKEVKLQNRFGGEECTVPGYAASVYDTIIGAERFGEYNTMRLGLDWFAKHFPKQYMVLLD